MSLFVYGRSNVLDLDNEDDDDDDDDDDEEWTKYSDAKYVKNKELAISDIILSLNTVYANLW